MKSLFVFLFLINSAFAYVEQGIDRISTIKDKLSNQRVAVLTHFAGQDQLGIHLIDKIVSMNLNLTLIFSPEHGLRSLEDDFVDDGIDPKTGVPIVSLYKRDKKFPSSLDIEKFDVLVIDLKDVGVRFYTYAGTIFQTIKVVIEQGKGVVLLDRVNPLGGTVAGPLLDFDLVGHDISYFQVPQSHGLTMGEYMNYELDNHPNRNLFSIVKNLGWDRSMIWDETGIEWISPSPALPTVNQAYLYSILGSLESLNFSVGRSKTNEEAFINYGAPWITKNESLILTKQLNNLHIEGVEFKPVQWLVTRSIYKDEIARGFKVEIIDFKKIDRFKTLYETLRIIKNIFGNKVTFNHWTKRYLGDENYVYAINSNIPYIFFKKNILKDEQDFIRNIQPFLLY